MRESDARYLQLKDGRQLCYTEYGDPAGTPVMVFHGNPVSRLSWGIMLENRDLSGIRVIAPDRPGYGQSDYKRGITTVENWPHDVEALADHLDLDSFAVFGPSGGGPPTLACAWKIPHRLTSVGIFGSVGPFTSESMEGGSPVLRKYWTIARRVPNLLRLNSMMLIAMARRAPRLYKGILSKEMSELDRGVYERLNLVRRNDEDRREAYRQGGKGSFYDGILAAHWPIPLEEITTKVHIWHGEEDISPPPAMAKYMAERIPDAELHLIPGAAHFWIYEHAHELIAELLGRGAMVEA